jgi:hypothetical protein
MREPVAEMRCPNDAVAYTGDAVSCGDGEMEEAKKEMRKTEGIMNYGLLVLTLTL